MNNTSNTSRTSKRKSREERLEARRPHYERIVAAVKRLMETYGGRFDAASVHVQLSNSKTASIGEGTAAGLTCVYGGVIRALERGGDFDRLPICFATCYAFRDLMTYLNVFNCQARNTVLREIDAVNYYRVFARAAVAAGTFRVRINESGDFGSWRNFSAFIKVAREFPAVRFWGYTQLDVRMASPENLPTNVIMRFSTWTDTAMAAALERDGIKTAVASEIDCNCPAQIAKARFGAIFAARRLELIAAGVDKVRAKAAAEEYAAGRVRLWTCADCAKAGAGCCCASRARQYFGIHGAGDLPWKSAIVATVNV